MEKELKVMKAIAIVVACLVIATTAYAAFSSTTTSKTVMGNKRVHTGTFTNGASDTGGDIETGLMYVDYIDLQQSGSATVTGSIVVNDTIPGATGDLTGSVTIITDYGVDGNWRAEGY